MRGCDDLDLSISPLACSEIDVPCLRLVLVVTIGERIAARGKQKRKKYHLVTSETLYALGIALMDRALSSGKPVTASSVQDHLS